MPAVALWISEGHQLSVDISVTDKNTGLPRGPEPPTERFLNENPGNLKI